MTKKKDEPAKASKKKRADKHATAGPGEPERGPASKVIDMKVISVEEALKLALDHAVASRKENRRLGVRFRAGGQELV